MLVTIQEVKDLFPELNLVKNQEWVEKTCVIWKTVLEKSKWESPIAAQFGISTPGIPLVTHTRATIQYSLHIAKVVKELHKAAVEIDTDVLIIAGVLHDVSKLIELEPGENGALCQVSPIGYVYQHGFYGAYYAEQAGFPPSIVTCMINHSAWSRMMPSTIEATILFFADQNDAEISKFVHGKSSMILKALGKLSG
jgi:hypothetical protein